MKWNYFKLNKHSLRNYDNAWNLGAITEARSFLTFLGWAYYYIQKKENVSKFLIPNLTTRACARITICGIGAYYCTAYL